MNPTDHFLEWAMIQACEDEDRRISFDEFVEILNLMESEEKRTKEGKNWVLYYQRGCPLYDESSFLHLHMEVNKSNNWIF